MQIPKIQYGGYNTAFGAIILMDERRFSKKFCDDIEAKTKGRHGGGFKSESLAGKRLIDEVIKNDYNTPELQETYKKLVESQKKNPVNIYIDLFTAEKGEIPLYAGGWFQKATVGNATFKQATTYFNTPPSPIKFLKRACTYANVLNFFRLGK